MLNDELVLAQRIVSMAESNLVSDKMFHSTSCIYIKSNEKIDKYQKYLERRRKILSVISSGDQILNCILGGTKVIDAFDVSVFPKYFLRLKMAAVKGLTREEYVNFFYGNVRPDERFDEMYDKIRIFLNGDALIFWDGLFDYFDWYDIYNSTLFSTEPIIKSHAIDQNKYLNGDNYKKLGGLVDDVVIKTIEGNILDIYPQFKDSYDLIYLSNIIYYADFNEYVQLLSKFNLNDQGIILSYLYQVTKEVIIQLKKYNLDVERIPDSECALVLCHK